jgi:hypothetical protein
MSADGSHLELVLQRDATTRVILASIPETRADPASSVVSVHAVDCPPSTGLAQRYFILGQDQPAAGQPRFEGLTGTTTDVTDGVYLAVIAADSIRPGPWAIDIGLDRVGGTGAALLDLSRTGEPTDAGCFFN